MPWRASDAKRHTRKADTPKEQATWSRIATDLLAGGASEGSAIRQANAVIAGTARHPKKRGKK
jgi:hypothetical protein